MKVFCDNENTVDLSMALTRHVIALELVGAGYNHDALISSNKASYKKAELFQFFQ